MEQKLLFCVQQCYTGGRCRLVNFDAVQQVWYWNWPVKSKTVSCLEKEPELRTTVCNRLQHLWNEVQLKLDKAFPAPCLFTRVIEELKQQKHSLHLQVEELEVKVENLSSSSPKKEEQTEVFSCILTFSHLKTTTHVHFNFFFLCSAKWQQSVSTCTHVHNLSNIVLWSYFNVNVQSSRVPN